LFECTFGAADAVTSCSSACVDELRDNSDACKDAVSALGACGVNLTCDDFAANACEAESNAVDAACNGLGGGADAGVDAAADAASG
jgi:hypothetical protein